MRLLGRYIFREILTSSLLGTALATFVIFLDKADALFKLLVGTSPPAATVVSLLLLALPPVLPFTVPFGVLIGILIGLGRMSADGEIIAMRAGGVSSRTVIAPVLTFAIIGMGVCAWASIRLTPYSYRESARIVTELTATRSSADVQERVFIEDFPNNILYVDSVGAHPPGAPVPWNRIFLADVTKPEDRKKGLAAKADGPIITTAQIRHRHVRPQERIASNSNCTIVHARNGQGPGVAGSDGVAGPPGPASEAARTIHPAAQGNGHPRPVAL